MKNKFTYLWAKGTLCPFEEKLPSLVCLIIFCCTMNLSYAQVGLDWAGKTTGGSNEKHYDIKTDNLGNIYLVGSFGGTVDMALGSNVNYLTTPGTQHNAYVQKLDEDGNLLWVISLVGNGFNVATGVDVDEGGNVYVTGYFQGTTDFDPGPAVLNKTSNGGTFDYFVIKFDLDGNLDWVHTFGGTGGAGPGFDFGRSIRLDGQGNLVVVGAFAQIMDFDPGPGVFNLSGYQNGNVFIQKLDTAGNFIWAKLMGGTWGDMGTTLLFDSIGNVYVSGSYGAVADFDPGPAVENLTAVGVRDIFIVKLDVNGDYVWSKSVGGAGADHLFSSYMDPLGNLVYTGYFEGTADLDPGVAVQNHSSAGDQDVFVLKLNQNGTLIWAKTFGGVGKEDGLFVTGDALGDIYVTGYFESIVDFDPGAAIINKSSAGGRDGFILKMDFGGNFTWVETFGDAAWDETNAIAVDYLGNLIVAGFFRGTIDFFPGAGIYNLSTGSVNSNADGFILKLNEKRISGQVYFDFNENCIQDTNDNELSGRLLLVNPGNIIVETNVAGLWTVDSLQPGTYDVTIDTSAGWLSTCPVTQSFTVFNTSSFMIGPSFGLFPANPCAEPDVSIHAPFLRPGFTNQKIYVQACNLSTATSMLDSAYVIVELDSLLTVQLGSIPYVSLGNNLYRVDLDSLVIGHCIDFWLDCHLSDSAILGQTLCMQANLLPIDSCYLDLTAASLPAGIGACNGVYDWSNLVIRPSCDNDTISFVITNTGDGDMDCFSQVRLYIDGQFVLLDSIQLMSGDTAMFTYLGNGQTWHMEVDQHPLHLGSSQPSANVELCGDSTNWTSNMVNLLPLDDANPMTDIYCGLVTGSYDPNDKTGYPLGVGVFNDIASGIEMEYLIRFQNTGTDTAFSVVIRDTLSTDLDVFTVKAGVSSHTYNFKMYGPGVLEWRFNNIMLPDSNVNELASHGFVKFKVKQVPGLSSGTVINNNAAIYFDYNVPVYTNRTKHTINGNIFILDVEEIELANLELKIYPNPTCGRVNVEQFSDSNLQVIVMDNLGRVLMSKASNDRLIQLNFNDLYSGVYFLIINDGNMSVTHKVVKY